MKRYFFLFLLLTLIPLATAEIQSLPHPVKVGSCVNLPQSYGNSTWQNITTIQLPDETLQVVNTSMANFGGGYFSYQFCNTTQNGEYIVNGIGDVDGVTTTWNYKFLVNPLGKIFTSQQATLYLLVFAVAFIFFILCVLVAVYLPSGNNRDQMTGYIFAVSNLKYLKMFFYAFSYLLVVLMVYFGYIISYGYLDLDFLGDLLFMVFYIMTMLILPLFVVGVFIIVANIVRDTKLNDMLSRGLRIR